jgi:spermidine synthase
MTRAFLYFIVFFAGFAALSWEILWQLKLSLAIGFSSLGTALTLATTMGGMTVGSLVMGRLLRDRATKNPLYLYLGLETLIGLSGLALEPGFRMVETWDVQIYQQAPGLAPVIHIAAALVLLGIPTLALGATIPVFALVSKALDMPLSWIYGMNTAGASIGCLGIGFILLPELGVSRTISLVAGLNFVVAVLAYVLGRGLPTQSEPSTESSSSRSGAMPFGLMTSLLIVFLTGFVTFCLEIAWFRSFKAAFGSRTESFAIMLSAVLVGLAIGARLAGHLSRKQKTHLFPILLFGAGLFILVATPIVERFDTLTFTGSYYRANLFRWLATLLATGPAIALLGTSLPWLLDSEVRPDRCAKLYACNTLGAILGSIMGAWILIPILGFARTSWTMGVIVAVLGLALSSRKRPLMSGALTLCLGVAVFFESGIGRDRIQLSWDTGDYQITAYAETPESTISVVELKGGRRDLVIDGFVTTGEHDEMTHYMKWMGHLPMMLHPDPKSTLVICFGTGQTARALYEEGAANIDVVELNKEVLQMAPFFEKNDGILEKSNVLPHVMDGRAWLRRTQKRYDVITLEPMAPTFAGVNNLYSREFYLLCDEKLTEGGVACQWLPFHLLHPRQTLAVASTFREVFPNCGLWLDPVGYTGLLVGVKDGPPVGSVWPGLERDVERSLTDEEVTRMMVLDSEGMKRFTRGIEPITDDNQKLAYGSLKLLNQSLERKASALNVIHWASTDPPPEKPDYRKLLDLRVELPGTESTK